MLTPALFFVAIRILSIVDGELVHLPFPRRASQLVRSSTVLPTNPATCSRAHVSYSSVPFTQHTLNPHPSLVLEDTDHERDGPSNQPPAFRRKSSNPNLELATHYSLFPIPAHTVSSESNRNLSVYAGLHPGLSVHLPCCPDTLRFCRSTKLSP